MLLTMIFQKFFSPLHHQVYAILVALLLLFPAQSQAQQKQAKAGASKVAGTPKGYGKATYPIASFGRPMQDWLVAGPLSMLEQQDNSTPDVKQQELFFNTDAIEQVKVVSNKPIAPVKVGEQEVGWRPHTAAQSVVDFDQLYDQADYAAAYALAEIKAESASTAFLAIGSDDGLKVWLNGKLVHTNWVPRGITPDEDMVPLQLQKGSNQLLIKVQDIAGEWGFTGRFLDKAALSDRLVVAAGKGMLEEIDQLLLAGAELNRKSTSGLTALNAAKLSGRQEMISLLLEKGAKETPMPAPEILADALFASKQDKEAPGIAVLVSKGGKIVYKKGFGYADMANKVAITPETKFRIGSNTKQFVAAAILKLQEAGKLQLTDKISKYFPGFPRGDEVTLHHLLTHTSGIHSYTNKPDFQERVSQPVDAAQLVEEIKKDPYDFEPGSAFVYNNSGYFMAGLVVEKVSGKSLDQYLKDTFFTPLQMHQTGVYTADLKLQKEALGYGNEGGTYSAALKWDMSWAGGAGALYSTVEDLFKWNEALFNGKVISEASLQAALTPVLLNDGSAPTAAGNGYGYGIRLDSYRDVDVVLHGGGLHGFVSQLARYPKEDLTVVLLANATPTQQHLDPNTLAEFYMWESMAPQTTPKLMATAEEDLEKYAGRYDFGNGLVMMVTADGGDLWAQLSGQPRFQIYPSAPGEYFWKVVDAKIKFVSDAQGAVTHGEFQQNGANLKVVRLKEEKIAVVDPKIFESFQGTYDFGNSLKVDITTEGGKLFAQATNFPKVELLPISEKEFFVKEFNIHFNFSIAPEKEKATLVMDIGGQKNEGPRVK